MTVEIHCWAFLVQRFFTGMCVCVCVLEYTVKNNGANEVSADGVTVVTHD